MPFPSHKYKLKHTRKEKDSFVTHNHNISNTPFERASGFTSRGSITVEATISVSIFFFCNHYDYKFVRDHLSADNSKKCFVQRGKTNGSRNLL